MDTNIKQIDGNWFAFGSDGNNVYSIGNDSPKMGGLWVAKPTCSGIKYVASVSPTREAAYAKAKRNGSYCGEWK